MGCFLSPMRNQLPGRKIIQSPPKQYSYKERSQLALRSKYLNAKKFGTQLRVQANMLLVRNMFDQKETQPSFDQPGIIAEEKKESISCRPKMRNKSQLKFVSHKRSNSQGTRCNKEKYPVSDAVKDKAWCVKASTAIKQQFHTMIKDSLGIQVVPTSEYFYYLGRGNNAKLVNELLKKRGWTRTQDINQAHLVWTQWKEVELLQSLPSQRIPEDKPVYKIPIIACPHRIRCPDFQLRLVDLKGLNIKQISHSQSFITMPNNSSLLAQQIVMHNKLENNYVLSNKKALYMTMRNYYQATGQNMMDFMPLTFHIRDGSEDPEFKKFELEFQASLKRNKNSLWIVKPGENSNRGNGISVCSMISQVKDEVNQRQCPKTGNPRTYIVQQYIERPLLIHKRKFDIRTYSLVLRINGILHGYFYTDGYLRTTSEIYSIHDIGNPFVHLTNDAIQKYSESYNKFEPGNKLSYRDFQRYLNFQTQKKPSFDLEILPQMRQLVKDTIVASYLKIDINRRGHCFEIFGYDFLVDNNFKVWLIEVNTNPCLEQASPYLAVLIPNLLQNAFRIALDPIFPPLNYVSDYLHQNKFELVFNELVDGEEVMQRLQQQGTNLLIQPDQEMLQLSDTEELYSDEENQQQNGSIIRSRR